MSEDEKPILYRPGHAIDHIQTQKEFIPLRLFAVLFPLWRTEIDAIQDRRRPYALIEHYLEWGIEEGELRTINDLKSFFGLSREQVEKILHFLKEIDHVTCVDTIWSLTERGRESLRFGAKSISQKKAQVLYFDGFQLHPLLREHYAKSLRVVDDVEADMVAGQWRNGCQFQRLRSQTPWHASVLTNLERSPDRTRYNLPEGWYNLQSGAVIRVYLPMYIIEAKKRFEQRPEASYVAYTHRRGKRDEYLEQIVNTSQEIQRVLRAEENYRAEDLWKEWLVSKGLAVYAQLERTSQGLWRAVLDGRIFRSSVVSIASIGTYHLGKKYILQVWCNNSVLRREAVLERTLRLIQTGQQTLSRSHVLETLHLLTARLETEELNLEDVYRHAVRQKVDSALLSVIVALKESEDGAAQ